MAVGSVGCCSDMGRGTRTSLERRLLRGRSSAPSSFLMENFPGKEEESELPLKDRCIECGPGIVVICFANGV